MVTALHATFLGSLSRQDYSEETKRKCYEIFMTLVANGADVNKYSGPCELCDEESYSCGEQDTTVEIINYDVSSVVSYVVFDISALGIVRLISSAI